MGLRYSDAAGSKGKWKLEQLTSSYERIYHDRTLERQLMYYRAKEYWSPSTTLSMQLVTRIHQFSSEIDSNWF
jgi:hypothetical protein